MSTVVVIDVALIVLVELDNTMLSTDTRMKTY